MTGIEGMESRKQQTPNKRRAHPTFHWIDGVENKREEKK
jgi:hypothetical protein